MLKSVAIAVSAASLAAGAAFAVASPGASPADATPLASHHNSAVFLAHPDIVHLGRSAKDDPPTSAECEQQYGIACYDPAQVQTAYNLGPLYSAGINGRGRTIAVVDVFGSPTIGHDLSQFDSAFGLPAPPSLKVIAPAGRVPSYNKNNGDMVGWAGETTLDVEYAHVIAPDAKILVVEIPESGTGNFMAQAAAAVNYLAKHHLADVVSQSFGGAEPAVGSVSGFQYGYQAAERSHLTVLASAGDGGTANVGPDMKTYYTYATTQYPSTDPLVTAVGGSDLHLNASGQRSSPDTVWNDTYNGTTQKFVNGNSGPNPLATGGGASRLYGRPSYQNSVRSTVGGSRGVPDVEMSGSCSGAVNVYQSFPGQQAGYYAVCGTSEASPLFAGIVRITSGNNTASFRQHGRRYTISGYKARNGYSRVAGVGTVNARFFVPELAKLA